LIGASLKIGRALAAPAFALTSDCTLDACKDAAECYTRGPLPDMLKRDEQASVIPKLASSRRGRLQAVLLCRRHAVGGQLQNGRMLSLSQSRQQHDVAVGKLERVVVDVRLVGISRL